MQSLLVDREVMTQGAVEVAAARLSTSLTRESMTGSSRGRLRARSLLVVTGPTPAARMKFHSRPPRSMCSSFAFKSSTSCGRAASASLR